MKKKSDELEFLAPVEICEKLVRRSVRQETGEVFKYWTAQPIEKCRGVFLGYRTLTNGMRRYILGELEYARQESFRAALVALNRKSNPIYVPLVAVEKCMPQESKRRNYDAPPYTQPELFFIIDNRYESDEADDDNATSDDFVGIVSENTCNRFKS